jgi:hypothetical protein
MAEQKTNEVKPKEQKESLLPDTMNNVNFKNTDIFSDYQAFKAAIYMAKALAESTIVPKDYQNNPANVLIALDMATRMNTSPMMVMQNLYVVNGRPAWSSQYIIAVINSSKKYKTELQYDLTGTGMNMKCTAWAEDWNGHKVTGTEITMQMAKDEGWLDKNMSKWKTMPEVMIKYRAASFFGRLNCPDMIMGIYSVDEIVEIGENDYTIVEDTKTEVKEEIKQNANKIEISAEDDKEPEETSKEPEPEPEQNEEKQDKSKANTQIQMTPEF